MNLPLLAQATGDVNSQICPMVHKIFTWDSLCVCTVLGSVLLIHSCLYAKRTLVKRTKRKTRAMNTAFSLFLLKILSSLLIPLCCSLSLDFGGLFLKLGCQYCLAVLSYSYRFSNCFTYFYSLIFFYFYFFFCNIFSLLFLHRRALCSGQALSVLNTSPHLFYFWLHWLWCYNY